jgi:Interferon-induced transmembrane protein/WW domain
MEPKGNKLEGLLEQDPVPVPTPPPAPPVPIPQTVSSPGTPAAVGGAVPPLPPGWATAISPHDGQMYFYELASGKSSWTHPTINGDTSTTFPPPPQTLPPPTSSSVSKMTKTGISRTLNESDRPDEHACLAIVGCLLFIPLGMVALIYSLKVDKAWDQGRTYDSVRYSRRAALFGQLACGFGAIFWIYWIFFSGPGGELMFHWPAEWFE